MAKKSARVQSNCLFDQLFEETEVIDEGSLPLYEGVEENLEDWRAELAFNPSNFFSRHDRRVYWKKKHTKRKFPTPPPHPSQKKFNLRQPSPKKV